MWCPQTLPGAGGAGGEGVHRVKSCWQMLLNREHAVPRELQVRPSGARQQDVEDVTVRWVHMVQGLVTALEVAGGARLHKPKLLPA